MGGLISRWASRLDAFSGYPILVRGGESNPIAASSVLINAYVQELARAGAAGRRPRVGWDFEDESPGQRRPRLQRRRRACRPRSRPTSSTPCSPTAPATTSTTPTPSCRRPSAPTPASIVRVRPGRRAASSQRSMEAATALLPAGPGDRRLQEQLRPQGQQLRLPRELPDGPGGAVRRIVAHVMPHFITRQIFTGAGKVGTEAAGAHQRRRAVPAHASGPTSSRRRSGSRPR